MGITPWSAAVNSLAATPAAKTFLCRLVALSGVFGWPIGNYLGIVAPLVSYIGIALRRGVDLDGFYATVLFGATILHRIFCNILWPYVSFRFVD